MIFELSTGVVIVTLSFGKDWGIKVSTIEDLVEYLSERGHDYATCPPFPKLCDPGLAIRNKCLAGAPDGPPATA